VDQVGGVLADLLWWQRRLPLADRRHRDDVHGKPNRSTDVAAESFRPREQRFELRDRLLTDPFELGEVVVAVDGVVAAGPVVSELVPQLRRNVPASPQGRRGRELRRLCLGVEGAEQRGGSTADDRVA
jgi:hypothetical protein